MDHSTTLETAKSLYDQVKEDAFCDYCTFLKFPSISSEKEYEKSLNECADWLIDYLQQMGFTVEKWKTSGHPSLFASWLGAGSDKPIILFYNHYDVQPVDPLELWDSPPFEPTLKNGILYARGAQDNKGQCFYVIQALKALLARDGTLPVNVKLCIEGEEEIGSGGLSDILQQKKRELKADYLIVADMGIPAAGVPALTLGIRGILTMDVEVSSSSVDLHSGTHGGIVFNPIHALVQILSTLRDESGKITVPGFYDEVESLSEQERKKLSLHFDEKNYFDSFGTIPSGGEKNYSPLERAWLRPTIEINGIHGGYTGTGFKTVIPAKASAKVSCRLVPNQNPEKTGKLVTQFLENCQIPGVKVNVQVHHGKGRSVRAQMDSPIVEALSKAYAEVFGQPTQYIFEGGAIPVITELTSTSESQVVMMGMGLATDQIHAPNEHFSLERFEQGFLVICRMLEIIGA